ncbi:MAG: hypothetical protein OXL34_06725 [Gemmatimonadota bacterium]|nr:hypothetical protein [Gemmatimonadota bacterium]
MSRKPEPVQLGPAWFYAPYGPRMMVKVLVYVVRGGHVLRRGSWRRKLVENIAFRMLATGNVPQHRPLG